jgi:hypothetical protein
VLVLCCSIIFICLFALGLNVVILLLFLQGVDTSGPETKGTVLIKSAEELEGYSRCVGSTPFTLLQLTQPCSHCLSHVKTVTRLLGGLQRSWRGTHGG